MQVNRVKIAFFVKKSDFFVFFCKKHLQFACKYGIMYFVCDIYIIIFIIK